MKIKYLQIIFAVILVLSVFSSSLVGSVSPARAQSSHTWDEPINLSNSGGAANPILVIDSLGVRHTFWVDTADEADGLEGYWYTRSEDGNTWSLPNLVEFPFNAEEGAPLPVLLAGQNGSIYTFWQNRKEELVVALSNSGSFDKPSLWESTNTLSEKVLAFDVAIDASGTIHVAYIRGVETIVGPAGVYYKQSTDGGRTWSDAKLLYASQYFHSTKNEEAHVSVAASNIAENNKVFVSWDNVQEKRIFWSASEDSGSTWTDAKQLKGPEDTGGYNSPYNVEISIVGDKSLLLWKVGEPGGTQCAVYSQWSSDWGNTWSESDTVLNYRSICPQEIEFLLQQDQTVVTLFSYMQGNPSIVAWNESGWGVLQVQDEISLFSNSKTYESIAFGCHNYSVYDGRLYLVGCDQGSGSDIWLTSRSILPIRDWLFPSSLWSVPSLLTRTTDDIPSMVYVAEQENLHGFWMQSSVPGASDEVSNILYSKWNASHWSPASDVMSGFNGISGDLTSAVNQQGRLFLVWSDIKTGSVLFSWANSGKADSSAEWVTPIDLPSPSPWNSNPDMLVDSSGMIFVAFAVPLNEHRGVYLVKSADNGSTWSEPIRVFDAEAAGWVMVNRPKIAITGDGRLHILFTNFSGLTNQPAELYYSQSPDGGLTWVTPSIVSDGSVVWSDLVSYGDLTVHRIWQQNKDAVVANIDQISTDGGETWGNAMNITGVSSVITPVTLASNSAGELHLIRVVEADAPLYFKEYNLSVQDWRWNEGKWESQPFQEIGIKGDMAAYSLAAAISAQGLLNVSLVAKYRNLDGEVKTEIYNIERALTDFKKDETIGSGTIATPGQEPVITAPTQIQALPSMSPTPYPDLSGDSPSIINKNFVGILLVLIVIGLTLFIFLRRVKKA